MTAQPTLPEMLTWLDVASEMQSANGNAMMLKAIRNQLASGQTQSAGCNSDSCSQAVCKPRSLREMAKLLHETRMKFCYPKDYPHNQPWPEKLPGDFGYIPQPWVDIAFEQAKAIMQGG